MARFIKRFFWICSGATIPILEREECVTDHNKYVGIGATVFFTGLLAGISGGFALYTVFRTPWPAVGFGLLWGAMIFNLDRFIVSSLKTKNRTASIFSWAGAKDWGRDLLLASPRLILAIALSVVISKPLELQIFEREIREQIVKENNDRKISRGAEVSNKFQDMDRLKERNQALLSQIESKRQEREKLWKELMDERYGRGPSGQVGIGNAFRNFEERLNRFDQYLATFEKESYGEIAKNNERIQQFEENKQREVAGAEKTVDERGGMAAQITALNNLGKDDPTYAWISRFILFLLILLECSPIMVKLFAPFGPYDNYLEEFEAYAVKSTRERQESKLKIEQQLNQLLEDGMAESSEPELQNAMSELRRNSIGEWMDKKMWPRRAYHRARR